MAKLVDLTGQTFGRLKVMERAGSDKYKQAMWLCSCDCGNYISVRGYDLRHKKTMSCGCYHADLAKQRMTKHGKAHTKLYEIWKSMNQRCYNKRSKDFPNYGGIGIAVCNEWKTSFQAFYVWAINNGYSTGLSIDRIKGDDDYKPNNCRWATAKVQANNTQGAITYLYITENLIRLLSGVKSKESTIRHSEQESICTSGALKGL